MKLKIDKQAIYIHIRFIDSIEYVVLTRDNIITNNKGWVNYITILVR